MGRSRRRFEAELKIVERAAWSFWGFKVGCEAFGAKDVVTGEDCVRRLGNGVDIVTDLTNWRL